MKVFISGGAGFIGSHLVSRLIISHDTQSIVVYDNFSSGTFSHLKSIISHPKLTIIDADVKHLGMLTKAMTGSDLVVHFAANPDIAKSAKEPDIDFWEGTYLTQNILEAMRINCVPEILYTSGSGVYGDVADTAFKESYGPCFPISTYGASKLACEVLISSYCHMFSIKGRAFRFANVVGPKQTHGVGYDFIRKLSYNSNELTILGDGTQSKSYIYVEDIIDAMLLVKKEMSKNLNCFDVYNVATDDYLSVNQIADIVCGLIGLNADEVNYIYTGGDRGWKGDVPKVLFNVEKIKELGWNAKRSSYQAIEASIQAMLSEL